MKFRVIFDPQEITVITEDGGIVCIREADAISSDEPRIAVTDYYQMKLTDPLCSGDSDNLFECLAEGVMYHNDWPNTQYNSLTVIQDALDWLCVGQEEWEICNDLFPQFFGTENTPKTNAIPTEYLDKINNADALELLDMILGKPEIINNKYLLRIIKHRNDVVSSKKVA